MGWFAVRHVVRFASGGDGLFEERITLWEAASADEAIARAELEVADYVSGIGGEDLELFQSFELFDPPADGREVFSLMRRSPLPADDYLDAFFDTGHERQRTH